MTDTVIVSRPTDKVAVLTLNRPDQLNAVNAELIAGMHGALAELGAERSVRAIVLTGAGRAFSAGVDLNGFGEPEGSEGLTGRRMGFAVQTEMSRLILSSPSALAGGRRMRWRRFLRRSVANRIVISCSGWNVPTPSSPSTAA